MSHLNFGSDPADPLAVSRSSTSALDLVPLGERMRMISVFRAVAVALIIICWLALPSTRGASFLAVAGVSLGYLGATLGVEAWWRRAAKPSRVLFGVVAMADSVFLAWASYGTAGLDTPLRYLVLLQLITICLLASFKTGIKLAVFNTWLLLGAVYLTELGIVDALGGEEIKFGDEAFVTVMIEIGIYFLVTLVTTGFAAINERELRRRRYDLEELAQFAMRLEEAEDPDGVAECLLDGIAEIYDCEPSTVVRRDDEGVLHTLASRGLDDPEEAARGGRQLKALLEDAPIISQALAQDKTVLVARAGRDNDAILRRFGKASNVVIVPLRAHNGSVVGAVVVEHPARRGSRIERRILAMIERFASHGSMAIENAFLLAEVKALAITDPLTGLANRRHLDNVLERACAQVSRGHGTLALMMIDIDHFKSLNDNYGHAKGDDVLKLVARTLEQDMRAGDLAARYGGEEFSVVMPGAHGDEVRAAADRLRQLVARVPHGLDRDVTISVGVAWAPVHGLTREALNKAADEALYRAKETGRNRVCLAELPAATERPAA